MIEKKWKTDHMTCFPIIKCCEKNKMDNSQNSYSSVEKTGKIKKMFIFLQTWRGSYCHSFCTNSGQPPHRPLQLYSFDKCSCQVSNSAIFTDLALLIHSATRTMFFDYLESFLNKLSIMMYFQN